MSAYILTRLACDRNHCEAAFGPVDGGITQTRRAAKFLGWGAGYTPAGLPLDLCPECYAEHERGRALALVGIRQAARRTRLVTP